MFGHKKFKDKTQQLVFAKGEELMHRIEKTYRDHVRTWKRTATPKGLFRARLFGSNFCVCAMTLALGKEKDKVSQEVYLALLDRASKGLGLSQPEMKAISVEILKEQSRALLQEMQNVGSGQYALAALYEKALRESVGSIEKADEVFSEPIVSVLGRLTGEVLAEWAILYQKMASQPIQVYTAGFRRTEKDSRRLGE